MSMYVSGKKDKVKKLKELAEKMGVKVLYSEEKISPQRLTSAMNPTSKTMDKINYSVGLMKRRYNELGRPVTAVEIIGSVAYDPETERLSNYLSLAYLRGMVERSGRVTGGARRASVSKKTYAYSPAKK